jgi:hypothetical protein
MNLIIWASVYCLPLDLYTFGLNRYIYIEASELVSTKHDINIIDGGIGSFNSQKYSNMDLTMTISMSQTEMVRKRKKKRRW